MYNYLMLSEEEKINKIKEIQTAYLEKIEKIKKLRDEKIALIKENINKSEVERILAELNKKYDNQ